TGATARWRVLGGRTKTVRLFLPSAGAFDATRISHHDTGSERYRLDDGYYQLASRHLRYSTGNAWPAETAQKKRRHSKAAIWQKLIHSWHTHQRTKTNTRRIHKRT